MGPEPYPENDKAYRGSHLFDKPVVQLIDDKGRSWGVSVLVDSPSVLYDVFLSPCDARVCYFYSALSSRVLSMLSTEAL